MKNGLQRGRETGPNEQHPSDVKTYNLARSISNYLYRIYFYPRRPTSCFLYPRFISHVHASETLALIRENLSSSLSLSSLVNRSKIVPTEFNSTEAMILRRSPSPSKEFRIIHVHASLIDRVITFDYSLLISPAAIIVFSF